MQKLELIVNGKIVGKQRPRVTRFGTFTPKKTKDYEDLIKGAFLKARGVCLNNNIEIKINCYFVIPASYSKKKRLLLQRSYCQNTPDIDNIAKIVLDALNKLAYKDDCQVVKVSVSKKYGDIYLDEDCLEIELLEI